MRKCVVSIYDEANPACDTPANCHLLVDPNDGQALRTLTYLLRRCKSDLDPKLMDLFKSVQVAEALAKAKAPLCEKLKLYGICDSVKSKCKNRHFLSKRDETMLDISAGTIEFKVKTILSCSHYLVQLKRIKNSKNEVVVDYTKLALKLLLRMKPDAMTVRQGITLYFTSLEF